MERPTRVRHRVLAGLCLAAALAYLCRNVVAVAESTLRNDLGLTKQESGWLMSAFFFSYALGQIPCSSLGMRFGPRRVLPALAALWSAATLAAAFVSGLAWAACWRVVQGLAQAGLFPTTTLCLARWIPQSDRATATGWLTSFMSLGGALCAWLTGWMLEWLDPRVAPGWNWRITFLVISMPGLIWAVVFWRWFRDHPREHGAVNAAEIRRIRPEGETLGSEAGEGLAQGARVNPGGTPWRTLAGSATLWWICLQQACRAAGYIFFASWFATYLQETRGVGVAKSGFLNMLPLLAVVGGSLVGGGVSDLIWRRTRSLARARCGLSAGSLIGCAVLIFLSKSLQDPLSAVLVISAGSFLAGLASPCAYALTIDLGGSHTTTVNATMNMMGNLGAWAFPIVVPWILERFGGWDAVLWAFGGLHLMAAAAWMMVRTDRPVVA